MPREERAGVAVGATAEKEEIEDGKSNGVAASEAVDKNLLILIRHLLHIIQMLGINRMHSRLARFLGNLIQQLCLQ